LPAQKRSVPDARVSVVIPVYNEEAVLPELRERLLGVLGEGVGDFEVLFVDDGSSDGSAALIEQMHERDPRFRCIRFSRNFGHQAAVTAGLEYARGDVVCVMDADLQDPPEVLPRLLQEWEKGSDVVYAVRRDRKEHPLKVALYELFYRLLSGLSAVAMPLDAGDFCLVSEEVVRELRALPEKERFVRGLRAWVGYRQTGVEYERAARAGGRSKYGLLGLFRLAMNGIVSFSDKPLIYVTVFGVFVSLLAFVYAGWLVVQRVFLGGVITGYASLMGGLLFLSGIQLMSLGLLGIYISKVFLEVKARPTYIVRGLLGVEERGGERRGGEG